MADAISAFVKFEVAKEASPICTVSKGESRHAEFTADRGWLELKEMNWSIGSETSFTEGGGLSQGKPTPENFCFKHAFDMAAPPILGFIASGSHFKEILFYVCKTTGANKTTPYLKVWLNSAYIVKAGFNVGSDGKPEQDVEVVFKHIKVEYLKQEDTGKMGNASAMFEWDCQTTTAKAGQTG